jgi:hypothetical protein
VGSDGAVEALLCEDLVGGLGRAHGSSGGVSVDVVVSGWKRAVVWWLLCSTCAVW